MRYLILCMLLMFGGNLTGETVSAQSFSRVAKMVSKLKKTIRKDGSRRTAIMIHGMRRDSLFSKRRNPKINFPLTDSRNSKVPMMLFNADSLAGAMQSYSLMYPLAMNSVLFLEDSLYLEIPQVPQISSNEFFYDINANCPRMFWEQALQSIAR